MKAEFSLSLGIEKVSMVKASDSAVKACLEALLRPAVRFSMRHSLKIQDILEAAKKVYLELASEDLQSKGEKVNTSRLSVVTGIHRRDVMRLAEEEPKPIGAPPVTARVIGQWEQDKRFQTAKGRPRVLTVDGEANEFKALVDCVSKDLNTGTVLFELERQGLVERTKNGVKLVRREHVFDRDSEEGYSLMAQDADDLICAVQDNLLGEKEISNLHARTEYDNIYVDAIPAVKKWILNHGSKFHKELRDYLAQFDKDVSPEKGREAGAKVIVGTFSRALD